MCWRLDIKRSLENTADNLGSFLVSAELAKILLPNRLEVGVRIVNQLVVTSVVEIAVRISEGIRG